MEFFIAGIIMFGGNYAPRGWAMCNGQLLAIAQNAALFSLIGTTYGGDGRTTMQLPDLRGRAPIGFGNGAGLPGYTLGMHAGTPTHAMNSNELANHTHVASLADLTVGGVINVSNESTGNVNSPDNAYLTTTAGGHKVYNTTRTGTATLASDSLTISGSGGTVTVDPTGNGQAFSIMQPSLAMNYIIALQGIFPSRS
jgi:microcystin-dependent protein